MHKNKSILQKPFQPNVMNFSNHFIIRLLMPCNFCLFVFCLYHKKLKGRNFYVKVSCRVCKQMFFLATNDRLSFSHSLSSHNGAKKKSAIALKIFIKRVPLTWSPLTRFLTLKPRLIKSWNLRIHMRLQKNFGPNVIFLSHH